MSSLAPQHIGGGAAGWAADAGAVAGGAGRGAEVLTSDPVLELVYRAGLLPLKDLRSVSLCLDSEEVTCIAEDQARAAIQRWAVSLQELVGGAEVFHQRVRTLVWDLETRMVQLEVPLWAVHPTLEAPLVVGQLTPMGLYDELMGVGHALRLMTHPAAWGQTHASIWDTVAASASLAMRPCLALMLATIIPVEARLSYVTLRHAAYADKETPNLGGMVRKILTKMMDYEYGPKDLPRATKALRQVGSALSPFSLYLMRAVRAAPERRLDQRAAERAALAAALDEFLEAEGDKALYCRRSWTRFLLGLEPHFLVAFYLKFLYDGFQ